MKGEVALEFLQMIGETATASIDVMASLLESPYRGTNFSEQRKNFARRRRKRFENKVKIKEFLQMEKRYRNTFNWLRRDGIIKEIVIGKKKWVKLTLKGRKYKELLAKRQLNELPDSNYSSAVSKKLIIVAFDIPEKHKQKRAWLRKVLKSIKMEMAQKSVWIGYSKIPSTLIHDLNRLKIIHFVEIFIVSSKGSLRSILSQRK